MNNFANHNLKITSIILLATLLASCGVETTTTSDIAKPTETQAVRILTQATFGPTIEEINRVQTIGTGAWFNSQFDKPQTKHMDYVTQAIAPPNNLNIDDSSFQQSFWKQAITGDDQLRQRVTFALSQIFVVSFQNDNLANQPRGMANYYDMLASHAFGNFRNLLEDVTKHPMMGIYLSALRNQKTVGARVPDENYAREVMQLFTIGLRKLNPDGSDAGSVTYTNDDIKGLAKVFTGWSWGGQKSSDTCISTNCRRFNASITDTNPAYVDPFRDILPMQNYAPFHEILQLYDPANTLEIPKSVLYTDTTYGVTIPDNVSGEDSLKIALDTLFNHPNVGPFIGRQLIQRLVTSNPSPGYISRVSAAFEASPTHPRGDMKALIKAVLTDPEAVDPTDLAINPSPYTYTADNVGKLREPVLRLANWMRAFHGNSTTGKFPVGNTDDPLRSLGQTPLRAPTVFNFYRPDYQAAKTTATAANLVAPEMQITNELSVFGYLNYMRGAIPNGIANGTIKADYAAELALVGIPELLLDRISLLLLQNNMSPELRAKILASMATTTNANNKLYQAIFLTMASPEYITQK